MTGLDRRTFNRLLAGALLGVGCRGVETLNDAPASRRPWGAFPEQHAGLALPSLAQPEGVFEVFMVGGLSPWESFYTVPQFGAAGSPYAGQQWWSYQTAADTDQSIPDWFASCGGGDRPLIQPFSVDSQGVMVNLGPFVYPLRDRPDILSRMRVWVVQHHVAPHEVAIPLAMSGYELGSPRQAALGAHVQRFHSDRALRAAPYSAVLYQSSLDLSSNGKAAWAIGGHRASARPMVVGLGAAARQPARLPRAYLPEDVRTPHDALIQTYLKRYRTRLGTARAPGLDDLDVARATLESHKALAALLPESAFKAEMVKLCIPGQPVPDEVTTGMNLAASLLTRPTDRARYVQLLDSGVFTGLGGLGYDGHQNHVSRVGTNTLHMLQSLTRIVNKPGENDPGKLDLNKHTVVLNTEFGRAPIAEFSPNNPDGSGTDHWPYGYVVVAFGGVVDQDRAGIVGAIGEDARAITAISPTEHRAALLMAMGIWPFEPEAFATADVRGLSNEADAAAFLREVVLGYPA